jgi:predicted enzyme related to lactoylglutathione lyase
MPHPVIWFEVIGKDFQALKKFYGDLFDWPMEDAPGGMPYAFVMPEGQSGLMGGIGSDPSGGPGHVTWYAQSDDPQADLDKAVSLGATVVMPPMEPAPGTTIALFTDPEGHLVGLVKPGPPPEQQQQS